MRSSMHVALQRCETMIARHDIQVEKYEVLLARTPRMHPCFESIEMLLVRERKRLGLEQEHRLRLLDRMYYASQHQAVGSGL